MGRCIGKICDNEGSERLMKMQDQIYNTYDQIGSLESKIRAQSS